MIKDLVSVIVPTYNRAHLIKRSVMSVLNQTYDNLELIIVDDGSTDNTEEIVKSIEDDRIIYIQQQNQGACAARNNGIDHAQGEFIAFQDSDDVWHKNKLERQLETLKQTGADLVFCKMAINGDANNVLPQKLKKGFVVSSELPIGYGTQTLCATSKIFIEERFDVTMPRLQDFELLLRLKKKYQIYGMSDILVDYCIGKDSISSNPEKFAIACEKLIGKYSILQQQAFSDLIIYVAYETNDKLLQKRLFNFSLKIYPSLYNYTRILIYRMGLKSFFSKLKSVFLKK